MTSDPDHCLRCDQRLRSERERERGVCTACWEWVTREPR